MVFYVKIWPLLNLFIFENLYVRFSLPKRKCVFVVFVCARGERARVRVRVRARLCVCVVQNKI